MADLLQKREVFLFGRTDGPKRERKKEKKRWFCACQHHFRSGESPDAVLALPRREKGGRPVGVTSLTESRSNLNRRCRREWGEEEETTRKSQKAVSGKADRLLAGLGTKERRRRRVLID